VADYVIYEVENFKARSFKIIIFKVEFSEAGFLKLKVLKNN